MATAQRIDSFKIMNTKVSFLFLNYLEKIGIIRGIEIECDKLCVYMKYVNNRVPFSHITIISKPSRTYPVTIEKLSQLVDRNGSSIFILSTGYGFLSHADCLSKRCSGDLVAKIDLQ